MPLLSMGLNIYVHFIFHFIFRNISMSYHNLHQVFRLQCVCIPRVDKYIYIYFCFIYCKYQRGLEFGCLGGGVAKWLITVLSISFGVKFLWVWFCMLNLLVFSLSDIEGDYFNLLLSSRGTCIVWVWQFMHIFCIFYPKKKTTV